LTVASGNKLDGLWFETGSRLSRHGVVDMTIYIHVLKEKRANLEPSRKKDTCVGYRKSLMEIDSEEQEALKDEGTDPSSPNVHP
jgi:hypothetical protein